MWGLCRGSICCAAFTFTLSTRTRTPLHNEIPISSKTGARTAHAHHMVLITVPRVGRSYELFLDGFDLHLLRTGGGYPPERRLHGGHEGVTRPHDPTCGRVWLHLHPTLYCIADNPAAGEATTLVACMAPLGGPASRHGCFISFSQVRLRDRRHGNALLDGVRNAHIRDIHRCVSALLRGACASGSGHTFNSTGPKRRTSKTRKEFSGTNLKTRSFTTRKTDVNVFSFKFVTRKSEAGPSGPSDLEVPRHQGDTLKLQVTPSTLCWNGDGQGNSTGRQGLR